MLVSDAHFVQGQGHLVCQDYAVSGSDARDRAWAVVADGCSGSPDTDMGARLLALLAARTLGTGPVDAGRVIRQAGPLARALGLAPGGLDATLLWAVSEGDRCTVGLSGDGLWAVRRADGAMEWRQVIAVHGAPRYLSYDLDPRRLDTYRRLTDNGRYRLVHGRVHADGTKEPASVTRGEDPFVLAWDVGLGPGDAVAICSDGIASFSADGDPVPAADVVREIFCVPLPRGRFVARRLRRFTVRACAQAAWTWSDDLAAGMVVRTGEQP